MHSYTTKFILSLQMLLMAIFNSCQAQVPFEELVARGDTNIIINKEFNLDGKIIDLPKDLTFTFCKGGRLRNGAIIGRNTTISGCSHGIFDGISISGDWNVEYISTDMFTSISSVDCLKEVMSLASPNVHNVLTIMPGEYKVRADTNDIRVLVVPSNTEVIMNGTIHLEPNALGKYYIFYLEGENIKLHGNGVILGDKYSHLDNKWEWGMGISIHNSNKVEVSDLTVKNCWGDCIYIDDNSQNIHINNCVLDNGRRQGISIISGDNILIENCLISNVHGTAPQFGIDIEPDPDKHIGSVTIKNVKVHNCVGGIMSWGSAEKASIGTVELLNCYVDGVDETKDTYFFNGLKKLELNNCHSDQEKKPRIEKVKIVVIN